MVSISELMVHNSSNSKNNQDTGLTMSALVSPPSGHSDQPSTPTGIISPLQSPRTAHVPNCDEIYDDLLEDWKQDEQDDKREETEAASLKTERAETEDDKNNEINVVTDIKILFESKLQVQTNWEQEDNEVENEEDSSPMTPKDILDDLTVQSDKLDYDEVAKMETKMEQRKKKKRKNKKKRKKQAEQLELNETSKSRQPSLSTSKRDITKDKLSWYIKQKQMENAKARSPRSSELEVLEEENSGSLSEDTGKENENVISSEEEDNQDLSMDAVLQERARVDKEQASLISQVEDGSDRITLDREAMGDRYQVDEREDDRKPKAEDRQPSEEEQTASSEDREEPEKETTEYEAEEPTYVVSFAGDVSHHTETDLTAATFHTEKTTETKLARAEQIKRELALFGPEDLKMILPEITLPSLGKPFNIEGLFKEMVAKKEDKDDKEDTSLPLEQTDSSLNILSDITSYSGTADEDHTDDDSLEEANTNTSPMNIVDTPIDRMLDWFDGTTKSEEESFWDERSDDSMNRASTTNDLLNWLGGH